MRFSDEDVAGRRTQLVQRSEDPTRIVAPWRRDRVGIALVVFESAAWVSGLVAARGDLLPYLIGGTLGAILGDVWLRWLRRKLRLARRELRERFGRR